MINVLKAEYPVSWMCRKLKIIRGSFYAWCSREQARKENENERFRLLDKIRKFHEESRGTYGSRRITQDLRDDGETVGRHKVAAIMHDAAISGIPKKKWKATTDSRHTLEISPNLLKRQFNVDVPNLYWVGDITYIRMSTGWQYLAIVIDLFGRKVVGWALESHIRAELVVKAFEMARKQRNIQPGMIFHSDRGSQYASNLFRKVLTDNGVIQSMSRKGNCWDNAVSESFFASIKRDLLDRKTWKSNKEVRMAVFEYIEVFYNRKRRHSHNGGLSPDKFENACINYDAVAA